MSLCCLVLTFSVTSSKIHQLQTGKNYIVGVVFFALHLSTLSTQCLKGKHHFATTFTAVEN